MAAIESDVRRMVDRHDQDLYRGNGKPGITTRIAVTEAKVTVVEECITSLKETIEAGARKTDRLTWLVAVGVGIIITLQFLLKR